MSTFVVSQFKRAHFQKSALWIVVGIFMTINIACSIAYCKWTYLVIAFAPFLVYLTMVKPFIFPFGLYVFLIPLESILFVEGSGATYAKLLGIASILTLLISGVFENKIKRPDKNVLWWGLFVLTGVFSLLWAISPELMYTRIPTSIGLFLLYLIISSYKIKEKEFDLVKQLIICGGVVASLYSIVMYSFSVGISYNNSLRASIVYGENRADPNQFAFSLLIPVALSIGTLFSARNRFVKISNWTFLGIISFAVLLTASRGALLGMGGIILTFMLSERKKNYLVITIILILSISFLFLPDIFFQRISISQTYETGGAGRTDIWEVGLEAVKHYWLIGAGLDNFPKAYWEFGPTFSDEERAPHNIYLGTAVELGIIGFVLLLFAIYKHYISLENNYYRYDHNPVILKAALSGLLVSAFFLDVTWRKSFWLIWMLIMMYNTVRGKKSLR